jgi:hypothetical protein
MFKFVGLDKYVNLDKLDASSLLDNFQSLFKGFSSDSDYTSDVSYSNANTSNPNNNPITNANANASAAVSTASANATENSQISQTANSTGNKAITHKRLLPSNPTQPSKPQLQPTSKTTNKIPDSSKSLNPETDEPPTSTIPVASTIPSTLIKATQPLIRTAKKKQFINEDTSSFGQLNSGSTHSFEQSNQSGQEINDSFFEPNRQHQMQPEPYFENSSSAASEFLTSSTYEDNSRHSTLNRRQLPSTANIRRHNQLDSEQYAERNETRDIIDDSEDTLSYNSRPSSSHAYSVGKKVPARLYEGNGHSPESSPTVSVKTKTKKGRHSNAGNHSLSGESLPSSELNIYPNRPSNDDYYYEKVNEISNRTSMPSPNFNDYSKLQRGDHHDEEVTSFTHDSANTSNPIEIVETNVPKRRWQEALNKVRSQLPNVSNI